MALINDTRDDQSAKIRGFIYFSSSSVIFWAKIIVVVTRKIRESIVNKQPDVEKIVFRFEDCFIDKLWARRRTPAGTFFIGDGRYFSQQESDNGSLYLYYFLYLAKIIQVRKKSWRRNFSNEFNDSNERVRMFDFSFVNVK